MSAATFETVCPYCNTERGTTCDYLEPIKDICKCADYRYCDYYQFAQRENGDSLQLALDEWEDKKGFNFLK